jgi:C-terminal processing protease CtpA/Prc
LLTSQHTISAPELFAYTLQARQRAVVVGETTAGAANRIGKYQINEHFSVVIPIGHTTSAVTGTNWEGKGVIPDYEVPAEEALKTAHAIALRRVLASIGNSLTDPHVGLLEEVQTALAEL